MSAETEISVAGHTAIRETLALEQQITQLHQTPVMVADLILGGSSQGLVLNHARAKLKEVQAVAKSHPSGEFTHQGFPTALSEHVQRFADTVTNAERYAVDRKR